MSSGGAGPASRVLPAGLGIRPAGRNSLGCTGKRRRVRGGLLLLPLRHPELQAPMRSFPGRPDRPRHPRRPTIHGDAGEVGRRVQLRDYPVKKT